jgi:hypothetical protein
VIRRILQTSAVLAVAGATFFAIGRQRGVSAVLTIEQGGTYVGTWEGDDSGNPVILVKTSQPVVIENSTIRGSGTLIQTGVSHAKITVRNTKAFGNHPRAVGKAEGRLVSAESFDSIDIEHNDIERTGGMYLLDFAGDRQSQSTIKILGNRVHNIDGRKSDGRGGFLNEAKLVQFVQLDKVRHVENVEIAWNQVINDPGESRVEDVISIYLSSGTPGSPIRIHDNFICGAYPANPTARDYSGGGIMLADGEAEKADEVSSFVEAFDNQVLNTTNYGIAISAGHDCVMHDNRIVSTGALPDGTPLPAQNVGAYIWNARHSESFANNSGFANRIGWAKPGGRNDWWVPGATEWKDNIHWPGPIAAQTIEDERKLWERKLKDHQISVGAN